MPTARVARTPTWTSCALGGIRTPNLLIRSHHNRHSSAAAPERHGSASCDYAALRPRRRASTTGTSRAARDHFVTTGHRTLIQMPPPRGGCARGQHTPAGGSRSCKRPLQARAGQDRATRRAVAPSGGLACNGCATQLQGQAVGCPRYYVTPPPPTPRASHFSRPTMATRTSSRQSTYRAL